MINLKLGRAGLENRLRHHYNKTHSDWGQKNMWDMCFSIIAVKRYKELALMMFWTKVSISNSMREVYGTRI